MEDSEHEYQLLTNRINKNTYDFKRFRVNKNTGKIDNRFYLSEFKDTFEELVDIAYSIAYSQQYNKKDNPIINKMYDIFYISNKNENIYLPTEGFVKTAAYKNILRTGYIMVGRKGSWKSTVVRTLKTLNKKITRVLLKLMRMIFS